MKKLILILLILTLSGCGNREYKTSYKVNEKATIDYFDIECTGYELINEYNSQPSKNGIYLKVDYNIINKNDKPVSLVADKFFKLYKNNDFIYGIGEDITLESNKEVTYTVVFDTSVSETYKVLFYSNVVTNNIAFELN